MDPAIRRRFLITVEFKPLRGAHLVKAYRKIFRHLAGSAPRQSHLEELRSVGEVPAASLFAVRRELELLERQSIDHRIVIQAVRRSQADQRRDPRSRRSNIGFHNRVS
jgi:hypothetical protein